MAERWQQWMPFHIDRWRGSPSVRAMHPAARMGYLELLCSCWQSGDCCIAGDDLELATASGLGDELWQQYKERILRNFVWVAGKWRNEVLFAEWNDALKVYEKRKKGAVRTNSSRTAHGERAQSSRNADTVTGTETSTGKKKKPLASTADAVPAERGRLLGTLPCAGGKVYEIHQDDLERDVGLFPGVDVGQEYRSMKAWLLASPKRQKTKSGIRKFMASWLTRAQDSPKPQAGAGNGHFTGKTESSVNAARQALAILDRQAADRAPFGEVGGETASETGHGRLLSAG